jgi:hypothetical protein
MDGIDLEYYPAVMFGAGVTTKPFISLSTRVFVINVTATLILKLTEPPKTSELQINYMRE